MLNRKKWIQRAFGAAVLCLGSVTAAHAQEGPITKTTTITAAAPSVEPFRASVAQIEDAPQHPRVIDKKFWAMSVLVMGLTISDLERTQSCLHRGTCVELNPMLPHSRAGMYAVNLPINAATMWLGYRMKSQGRRTWWIAPALVAAGHGIGTAFRF